MVSVWRLPSAQQGYPENHFPFPFIHQVLDALSKKKYFSFLEDFSGYNQIQIALNDQDKTTFTCPWGTFSFWPM